jgi:hypothetical protein
MTYKCGHDPKPIIINDNILSFAVYEEWRTSKGFDGDNSMCYNCYVKTMKENIIKDKEE